MVLEEKLLYLANQEISFSMQNIKCVKWLLGACINYKL